MKRSNGRLIGDDEINQILAGEDEILPSSGFAVSVMDAVRREAAVPAPIPFPWSRAMPGMVVGGLVLAFVLVSAVVGIAQLGKATSPHLSTAMPIAMPSILNGSVESAIIWTALALLVAFVSVKLSMRMASGRA